MSVTERARKKVVTIWFGEANTICEASDGTYTRTGASTVEGVLSKTDGKLVKWWTAEDIQDQWDILDTDAIENCPDWVREEDDEAELQDAPIASGPDERAKMIQFFIGKENTCGCECGAWATNTPDLHYSWCCRYDEETDPASNYLPSGYDAD